MDRVHRLLAGDTVHVEERSLIIVIEMRMVSANGGCFGQAEPHALVILDAEEVYFCPFVAGLTLGQLLQTVPGLKNRIQVELERRIGQKIPASGRP